ncbi:MAG: sigma-70 family RNA polymerase sigma factor [Lachnospiraceae bacterium]|nr:sigma-70 family RNA polymerase sigma factor [Lachnospiraceae bacterium]
MTNYSIYGDEELCRMAAEDPKAEEYLLVKYKELVRLLARNYFLPWGEWDDLLQEGMIGLLQAIRDYRPDAGTGFETFAGLCIRRKMMNAVTASKRRKHSAMEDFVSLDSPAFQNEDGTGLYGVGLYDNPESQLISKEDAGTLRKRILDSLSKTEHTVFMEYMRGLDYREIAAKLGKTPKSVDNTLQRIRKKVRTILNE